MILPITLTMAGAATLLNIWLATRVGQMRQREKVLTGDGGSAPLIARMRAQANFVEYAPFFLILLGLIELAHGSSTWLWAAGILFILARILHAFGMEKTKPHPLRMTGIGITFLVLLGLAGYAITIPYLTPAGAEMTVVPAA